jgi:uncharacterized protein YjiS (DUF1127 family)
MITMSGIAIRHSENAGSSTVRGFLRSLVKRLIDKRIYALAEADLRQLDDRELADIGLERREIGAAVRGTLNR